MKHFLTAKLRCLEITHILQRGLAETHSADPRTIGFLLGVLQLAGGGFLCLPFARFVPPFIELFKHLPPWLWAAYFIISGFMIALAACLPADGNCLEDCPCLSVRYYFAVWSFANWMLLTSTCFFSIMYLLARSEEAVIDHEDACHRAMVLSRS